MQRTLQLERKPDHVAIIMDGNGRWARQRGLPRVEGHRKGIEVAKKIVEATIEFKIPYLTLYAFSKENWARPKYEVEKLLELLEIYLDGELESMMENGVRFLAIGEIEDFPERIRRKLREVMEKTEGNSSLTLSVALSYSGRKEIIRAVDLIVREVKSGKDVVIDEENFKRYLYTKDLPDPDLLIRTSGEKRLSNFLLYQMAYSELFITETLWPDFTKEEYLEALKDYSRRERRFGTVKEEGCV